MSKRDIKKGQRLLIDPRDVKRIREHFERDRRLLITYLKNCGLTQYRIHQIAGLSQGSIKNLVEGHPKMETLLECCEKVAEHVG